MSDHKLIPSQAPQECGEGVETRPWSPDRTVKAHECAAPRWGDEIVRHSDESRRDRIKSLSLTDADFGRHQVILNRYGRDSVVLCIDPSFWAVRYLRKPMKRELARTGDARKYQIITEWALVARNWKANSKVVACA